MCIDELVDVQGVLWSVPVAAVIAFADAEAIVEEPRSEAVRHTPLLNRNEHGEVILADAILERAHDRMDRIDADCFGDAHPLVDLGFAVRVHDMREHAASYPEQLFSHILRTDKAVDAAVLHRVLLRDCHPAQTTILNSNDSECSRRGSNSRPLAHKTNALTD